MSRIRTVRSSQMTASRPLSLCREIKTAAEGSTMVHCNSAVWKSKNYGQQRRFSACYLNRVMRAHVDSTVESTGNHSHIEAITCQTSNRPLFPFRTCTYDGALWYGSHIERLALRTRLHIEHVDDSRRRRCNPEVTTSRDAGCLCQRRQCGIRSQKKVSLPSRIRAEGPFFHHL